MRTSTAQIAVAGLLALGQTGNAAPTKPCGPKVHPVKSVQLGPRPYWLVDNMDEGPLKRKLDSCKELQMKPSKLSIGHRGGGTLQIPEHTRESILAGRLSSSSASIGCYPLLRLPAGY
jgi:glycerophosphoryl diester phosphodiesterase